MKTDARIERTRHLLKDALMKLLQEKNIHDISVRELCDLAGVSRATFYKHYRDCIDLMENVESSMLEDYILSLRSVEAGNLRQMFGDIFDLVTANHGAFQFFIAEQHNEKYFDRLIELGRSFTLDTMKARLRDISEPEMNMLYTCLASGLLHTMVKYCHEYDRDSMLLFAENLFHRAVSPYMD